MLHTGAGAGLLLHTGEPIVQQSWDRVYERCHRQLVSEGVACPPWPGAGRGPPVCPRAVLRAAVQVPPTTIPLTLGHPVPVFPLPCLACA